MRVRRYALLVLLAWLSAGCIHWAKVSVAATPANLGYLERARITLWSEKVIELDRVIVASDSVVGFDDSSSPPRRVGFALENVQSVEKSEFSALKTAGLIIAIPIVSIVLLYALIIATCAGCGT
jgi:hypothetical protein